MSQPMSGGRRRHHWTRGERLRSVRGRLTQLEWARLLGVSRNTVIRYERDAAGADKPIVIMRWAEVSGETYEWLQYGDEPDGDDPAAGPVEVPDGLNERYPGLRAA